MVRISSPQECSGIRSRFPEDPVLRSFAGLASSIFAAFAIWPVHCAGQAITADGTLSTSVGNVGDAYTVSGGTVKGTNLFHSFGQFNVPTFGSATFDGPGTIQNVISRVTGGSLSSIDGLISTRGAMPAANFYLINPGGVVFGANASLDVGGSFRVSTADYIRLDDGVIFSAVPGAGDALLSSAPPQAFGFLASTPAPITVDGAILVVDPSQTLSLVGGDVSIVNGGVLFAPGGLVQVVSAASPGIVDLNAPDLSSFSQLGTVTVSGQDFTTVISAGGTDAAVPAGTVMIRGGNLVIEGANAIVVSDTGDFPATSTGIDIRVKDSMVVRDGAIVQTVSFGAGDAGGISIAAGSLMVSNGGVIESVVTNATGKSGAIDIAVGNAQILSAGVIRTNGGVSDAGNLTLTAAGAVTVSGTGSEISSGAGSASADPFAPFLAGNISVVAADVVLQDGARIRSGGFNENAGQLLNVSGTNAVSISGLAGISSQAFTQSAGAVQVAASQLVMDTGYINTSTLGTGNAGQVLVNVNTASLVNGAQIASSSQLVATGNGGTVTVNAPGSITISGVGPAGGVGDVTFSGSTSSGFFSTTQGVGNAGQIVVATAILTVTNGGKISVTTQGSGSAGSILANVGNLVVSGGGRIDSSTLGAGAGGAVTVNATGGVSIVGAGGGMFSTASSSGAAGAITVAAPTLMLGDGGRISVTTEAGGNAGTVLANVGSFDISGGARIDSSTAGGGAGGAIAINATGGVSIGGTGTGLFSTASSTGNAGQVTVSAPALAVSDGGKISVVSTGAGDAGSVVATGTNVLVTTGGQIDSSSSGAGDGGAIDIGALRVEIADGGSVRADSTGAGLTGNITIAAADRIIMSEGSISTRAVSSDGGNITLTAPNVIRLQNSQISTSVESGVGGGGNVFIDPQFVLMDGSSITANAFGGPGGNITIVANNFVTDPTSFLSASSALSTPGTVRIESPDNNLASDIAQLPRELVDASRLLRGGCTARRTSAPSSFVVAGRGGVPADPDGYLPSFSASGGPYTGARSAAVNPGFALAMAGWDCWQ